MNELATRPILTVLSLGWGVQSWTLAAMAALGEIAGLDLAIHADTTWEHAATYDFAAQWTPWLQDRGVSVLTVRGKRAHTMVHHSSTSTGKYILIPAFSSTIEDGERGQIRRQCTGDWKIEPQDKAVNAVLRERFGSLRSKDLEGRHVEKWLGISMDEFQRAKNSRNARIIHRYPLLERRMTRQDCIQWLKAHGLPVPPKSACVFCPFHAIAAWQELKRKGGQDWQTAIEYDHAIRDVRNDENATVPVKLYVHPARKPLAEAVQIPEDHGMQQEGLSLVEDAELATCDSGHCFL